MDTKHEVGSTASATGIACAAVYKDLSLRQKPVLETQPLISNTREGTEYHGLSISACSVLGSKDTILSTVHPQIGSTNDEDHMELSPILPGSLFSPAYFPTTYDRTRLIGNMDLGDKTWVPSSPAPTGSCAPIMESSSGIEPGLTESSVLQSFKTDKNFLRNTASCRSSDHDHLSLTSVVPSKKDDVLSIRHILNPDIDDVESANLPQVYDMSSHSSYALRNPFSRDNDWDDQRVAAEVS